MPELATITDSDAVTENWGGVDSWWATNIATQRDALVQLQADLETAQTAWAESTSRFDVDPLTEDWTPSTDTTGPLRPHQEENWSQWFAHLLRTAPACFSRVLFGEGFNAIPRSVQREVHLPAYDNPDRYADILAFYDEKAVSIEVKKGDQHYEKTLHTASLIDSHFRSTWNHTLLLPRRKMSALRTSFPDQLSEQDDGNIIRTEESDIAIIHWLDVGRAIREVLLSNADPSAHWEASAYLFCTLIEQKMARFVPKSIVDRLLMSEHVVDSASSLLMSGQDVENQIAYLQQTTGISQS